MKTTIRKIGSNRGKPRLWIEGKALVDAGLPHGSQWVLVPHLTGFDIAKVDQTGESKIDGRRVRKIAGTPQRPIIDIAGNTLAPLDSIWGMPETVALHYEPGSGFIAVRPDIARNSES